jgi:hypothetical protein
MMEDRAMSIIRVGLAETKKFAEGYEAIFGKKEDQQEQKAEEQKQEKQEPEARKEEASKS